MQSFKIVETKAQRTKEGNRNFNIYSEMFSKSLLLVKLVTIKRKNIEYLDNSVGQLN